MTDVTFAQLAELLAEAAGPGAQRAGHDAVLAGVHAMQSQWRNLANSTGTAANIGEERAVVSTTKRLGVFQEAGGTPLPAQPGQAATRMAEAAAHTGAQVFR